MTIYHVAFEWDRNDLTSLSEQMDWCDDTADLIAGNWTEADPYVYYHTEGRYIHCHATLADALDYLDEWCAGGMVLEINASELDVEIGKEYPHPVIRREIPRQYVRPVVLSEIDR